MDDDVDWEALAGLSSLDDPVRRRLYRVVAEHDGPVSRDDAAAATGISRSLAAYHLDKLVDAGLLRAGYARPSGRGGPGAGRPAKLYSQTDGDLRVSVPPRDYELLARILAGSIAHDETGAARAAANRTAFAAGRAAVDADADLMTALRRHGYQPRTDVNGDIELRNCPFRRPALDHQEVVCELNRSLLEGILSAMTGPGIRATPESRPGCCCVVLEAAPGSG